MVYILYIYRWFRCIWAEKALWRERSPPTVVARGGEGGGYLTKFNTGRLHPEVQPLTLLYTILAEKVPLVYTFY